MIGVLTAALLGGLILLFYILYGIQLMNWKKRGIKYMKCLPIVGNNIDVILGKRSLYKLTKDLYDKMNRERYCGYMQFMEPMIFLRDPEIIHNVLVKDFHHFQDKGLDLDEALEPLTGNLLHLTGDRWKIVRHALTPSFTSWKLKQIFNQIVRCADDLTDYIENSKTGKECRDLMQLFNINVIGLIAFGLEVEAFNEKNDNSTTFLRNSTIYLRVTLMQLIKYMAHSTFPVIARLLRIRIISAGIADFFLQLIQSTIKYRENTKTRRNDFLQVLIDLREQEKERFYGVGSNFKSNEEKNGTEIEETYDYEDEELLHLLQKPTKYDKPIFTEECIAANSLVFLSGGTDITSSVLSFIFYELAVNPDLQERVQKEIDKVISEQTFNYEAIKDMSYLGQFIHEVMRMHPVVCITRRSTADYKVPNSELTIKQGEIIYVPVYSLHMDPKYFPEPNTFNPDRFKDMQSIPKGVYMPFGTGPRMCIAIRLAQMLMKMVVAKVMLKYTVILSDKTKLPLEMNPTAFFHHAVNGIWVKFIKRHS